jgi:myo-inositol 2-dehydrogenase/D-chiro-inositol 1-dehydrogenase
VGCGRVAERCYAPALANLPGVELAAVVDPRRERRDVVAGAMPRAHAVARFDAVPAMLAAEPGLDAVIVATPVESHIAVAELAASAGLPALVEKPPAADARGAERLAELTPAPRIGFNRRFDQGLELRDEVPSEGDLVMTLAISYRRRSWSPVCEAPDALLDLGGHLVDLALFLADAEPVAVLDARLSADNAAIELETTRGMTRIECESQGRYRELVEIRTADGAAAARSLRGGVARGLVDRARRTEHPLARSIALQVAAFASALRGHSAAPLASADDGAVAMRVLDAARSASEAGAPVPVEVPGAVPA